MIVPEHTQAIRIGRGLLLALLAAAAACGDDDVSWTDPLTMSTAADDARLLVDAKGRARLVADTSVSVHPTVDPTACEGSVRAVRLDDGTLAATWWSVRPDSSAVLVAALSADGGGSWRNVIHVDTVDVSSTGCNRPGPAIAGSAGFVHLTYAMRATEGVGIFYAHSMNNGQSYEPPVTIVYGDRLTHTDVAAQKGTVAIAYEDPSGSRPQIGLAISRDWGHIFRDRIRGSTGVGTATDPQVSVAGREIAVSWLVGPIGAGNGGISDARANRIVRVGRLR